MKIFISYSHNDSNIVLPIAEELSNLYGKESILIDEFKTVPGDSLIGFMNESLETFTHFLFFISHNSLNSYMVSLEWKNALIICNNPKKRFVPIIIDSVKIPSIILDIKHINMYAEGKDSAMQKINGLLNESEPMIQMSENLVAHISRQNDIINLSIVSKIYTEPNASFCILLNQTSNIKYQFSEPFIGSNEKMIIDGKERYALFVRLFRVLTKEAPFLIEFTSDSEFDIYSVMQVEDINGHLKGHPIKIEYIK